MSWIAEILGRIGAKIFLKPPATPEPVQNKKTKYKDVYFPDATFPDDPYKFVPVKINSTIKTEYIPALEKALPEIKKGLRCLMVAMTHQEGFKPGTRSYKTNNPGNIGNTDSGGNSFFPTLEMGVISQARHLEAIANGGKKYYPLGKLVDIRPYYSKEIANNPQYGLPPYLPGYKFVYTGELRQFIKIYSTGARATNSYLNVIISFFAQNGLTIQPDSKLQDIIAMG